MSGEVTDSAHITDRSEDGSGSNERADQCQDKDDYTTAHFANLPKPDCCYQVDYAEGPSRTCLRGRWVSDQTFRHDTLCRWPLVLTG
jgi:hypothetical protein